MDIEDCCSSTSSPLHNNHQKSLYDLGPFVDRFRDIPEPIRGDMIEASFSVLRHRLERIVEKILGLKEPCSACTEQLADAVLAADRVGMEGVEEYRGMVIHLIESERLVLLKRMEVLEKKHGRWIRWYSCFEKEQDVDDDDDDVLEIYD